MSERGTVQDGRSGPKIQEFLRAQGAATAGEAISSHRSGKQGKSYIVENHEHSLRSFPNETGAHQLGGGASGTERTAHEI